MSDRLFSEQVVLTRGRMLNSAGDCGISVGEMLHFILFLSLQGIPGRKVKAGFVVSCLLSCPSCITLKPILNTIVNSKFFVGR